MNVSGAAQLDAMAAGADNAVGIAMLKKSLDSSAASMAQLLESLPQKDGSGQLVDTYA